MTIVCGVADGSDVWVGADGMSTIGGGQNRVWTGPMLKLCVRDLGTPVIVGASCNVNKVKRIVQVEWDAPKWQGQPTHDYAEELAVSLGEHVGALPENVAKMLVDDDDGTLIGAVLVGMLGHVYVIGGDYSVTSPEPGRFDFLAVGAGIDVAIGALDATAGLFSPAERVKRALEACGSHLTNCGPPYEVEHVSIDGTTDRREWR